jgi:hypothetical protein
LETKLDTIENILESLALKANQLRDEVFDKPAELEEIRATSEEFQDMFNQVVSFIRQFINKIKPKPDLNEPPTPPPRNLNLPVMPLPPHTKTKSTDSSRITRRSMTCSVQRLHYLKESLKGEAAILESTIDSCQSFCAAV